MNAKLIQIGLLSFGITAHSALALDTEFAGFAETRVGARTQDDPTQDQMSLGEIRLQLDALTYFETSELQIRADLLYDGLQDDLHKIDLDQGTGFIDLRELNYLFTPIDSADVKIGRQILTWGTGDLLFINDLFPKDWNSFLLGRDEEYLKAPSDAVFASWFPAIGSFDVAYMPKFDPDRYVDGTRLSYWNGTEITGDDFTAEERDTWFEDYEFTARYYRPVLSWEGALYFYNGFWKSPVGYDLDNNNYYFPRMNAYGASAKGSVGSALASVEVGYYDSRESTDSSQIVPEDEFRFLTGYEKEIAKELTMGLQYYLEWMQNYDDYVGTRDEFRHVLTLRLTQMMMNQNLMLGLFTFYSPSDSDAYFRLNANYKITDNWQASVFGNFFIGEEDYTFFGQLENNSNVGLSIRYSF